MAALPPNQVTRVLPLLALRDQPLVLCLAPLSFLRIAGKEDNDGMKVRTGQASDPIVRMVRARVAEYLRTRYHALLELSRKAGQRALIHTQRSQTVPGESHQHPSLVLFERG